MDRQRQGKAKILSTKLMEAYVKVMQARLKARGVGGKKEFFREFVKEVKIDGDNVTVTYRWPLNLGAGGIKEQVLYSVTGPT